MTKNLPNLVDLTGRVLSLVEKAGSQAAASRLTGIPQNTMSRLCRGENEPGAVTLAKFAQGMGVSIDWLVLGDGAQEPQSPTAPDFTDVPLLDIRVAAGAGGLNEDRIGVLEIVPFPERFIRKLGGRPKDVRFFRPSGDSMAPTILDGALVMFDHSQNKLPKTPKRKTRGQPDDIWVFLDEGKDLRVKRLRRLDKDYLAIISDNADEYQHEILAPGDAARIKIVGRAIWWDNRL